MINKRNKCVWRKEKGFVILESLVFVWCNSACFPLPPVPRLSPLLSRKIGQGWGSLTF